MILFLLFLTALFLAFSNGANDNFRDVAPLFGSGTTNYKGAISWATITSFIGAITASIHGMTVSTTHVSVGSIFGIGMNLILIS